MHQVDSISIEFHNPHAVGGNVLALHPFRSRPLNSDLVVMATHTRPDLQHALEESVTANVVRHANRPLMVWAAANCGEVSE